MEPLTRSFLDTGSYGASSVESGWHMKWGRRQPHTNVGKSATYKAGGTKLVLGLVCWLKECSSKKTVDVV
ncbi:unnamed protein product [Calypogeia fissa]